MAVKNKRPTNFTAKQVRILLRRVGGLDPGLRGNMSEKQITKASRKYVGANLDPIRDETGKALERRSFAGTGAISGYTKEHEAQLGKIPGLVDESYARQRADEQASQEALTGFLRGRGESEANALASKFQAAGIEQPPPMDPGHMPPGGGPDPTAIDPTLTGGKPLPLPPPAPSPDGGAPMAPPGPPGPPVPGPGPGPIPSSPAPPPELLSDRARKFGAGVAGEAAASGFSGLSRIGSEGASQRAYAHMLPGIAALGGAEAVTNLQLQLNRERSDRLGEINSQAPGMIAQQGERFRDRNLSKAGGRGAALNAYLDRELQRDVAGAGLGLDYAKLSESSRQANQSEHGRNARAAMSNSIAAANAAEKQRHDRAGETGKDKAARRPNAALSAKYGYIVDANGKPILGKNGKKIKVVKSNSNPYGP